MAEQMVDRIGIIGGGQLGRMLTQAAIPLGFEVTVIDKNPNCPAAQFGAKQIVPDEELGLKDPEAVNQLAEETDVLTWEIEHIDAPHLQDLEEDGQNIHPSPSTLRTIQDKLHQKTKLRDAGLPVAPFGTMPSNITQRGEWGYIRDLLNETEDGIIFKSRRGGYDGRGNFVYDDDVDEMLDALGTTNWSDLYYERMVPFERELSVIVARDQKNQTAVYPVVETVHKNNICHTVVSPADIDPKVANQARELGHETLRVLNGAGVFAIEMFDTGDDLMINEIAPRVHNSGHHTIEAHVTSQFEQHIRAVTGMPLGSIEKRSPAAAMINILGKIIRPLTREGLEEVLAMPDVHPHFYGKASEPNRKIGHVTVLGETRNEVLSTAKQAREYLKV